MKSLIIKYYRKIKSLPFFKYNDFKANLIFVLGIIFFFVIMEDLEKEFAKEKNEIGFFTSTLTESVDSITLGLLKITFVFPSVSDLTFIENIQYVSNQKYDFPTGRSPPL